MKDACIEDDNRKFIVQIDENDKDREKKLMFINIHDIRDISKTKICLKKREAVSRGATRRFSGSERPFL